MGKCIFGISIFCVYICLDAFLKHFRFLYYFLEEIVWDLLYDMWALLQTGVFYLWFKLFDLSRSHPTPDSYSSLTRHFHLSPDSSSLFHTCSFLLSPASCSPPQLLSHRFRQHPKQQASTPSTAPSCLFSPCLASTPLNPWRAESSRLAKCLT
jgi:hypothetical protein